MRAEELLREGNLAQTLEKLQQEVRDAPADPKLRVFLFQLLCILGRWEKAMTQLNIAAELDAVNLPMAHVCRPALNSEALRKEIWAGKRSPVEPLFDGITRYSASANTDNPVNPVQKYGGEGHIEESQDLRARAFERAPAIPGTMRELGQDYRIKGISRHHPVNPVIPSKRHVLDTAILMARKTEWIDRGAGLYEGYFFDRIYRMMRINPLSGLEHSVDPVIPSKRMCGAEGPLTR